VGQFAGGLRAERGGRHGAGAALDEDQQSQQRVAQLQPLALAFGVAPGDRVLVGHVQAGAVDGHGAQAPVEHAGLPAKADRPGRRFEQPPQRRGPNPAAGPRQRGHRGTRERQPAQPGGQLVPHRPVGAALEQRQREHEVDHDPGGQQAQSAFPGLGLLQYRVDQREVDHLGQLTHVPGREHAWGCSNRAGDDRLLVQRDSRRSSCLVAR
jgi:hypothetical protein